MIGDWLFGGGTVEVRCDIDIEQTPDSFHAYAIPDGVDIRPGDVVTVHDAPTGIGFGDRFTCVRTATVQRAGVLGRAWTELTALLELTELYEVGFQPKETGI
jgi:hypothetical protein